MNLSACIVVYNGYDEVLKAAQTVLQFTRRYPLTLYLVDNASPDGSGPRLEQAVREGLLAPGTGQQVEVRCRKEAALAPATTPCCRSLPAPTTSSSTRISSSWPIPSVTWPTGWPGTRMP